MKAIVYTFLFLLVLPLHSQISGKVVQKEDNTSLPNVFIKNINGSEWTISDENGNFLLKITEFPITLKFHLLGKVDVIKTFSKPVTKGFIYLKDDNLKLKEVVVTAKKKKNSTGSNIVLSKQAINLVQAQSLADVTQLIPGKSISESQLHERQLLNLRTAIHTETNNDTQGISSINNNQYLLNNSFGVGYVIDDIPIHNNNNLSGTRVNDLSTGIFSNVTENNSVGGGLDLKNISLTNIESIEVVQGISSARYGDHNTGLIKITRGHGYTPYRLNTTLRGGSYGVTLTKGYELGEKFGNLNLGVDYLHSNADPRNTLSKFNRININTSWSYKKKGKMTNRFTFSYGQNINTDNSDLNVDLGRTKEVDEKRFRIANTNTLYFSSNFIDELTSTISIDYTNSFTTHSVFKNLGGEPVMGSLEEGTYELGFTPVAFREYEDVDNKPLSFFSRIEASKTINDITYSLGTSFAMDDNFGKGNAVSSDKELAFNSSSTGGSVGRRYVNFNEQQPTEIRFSAYGTAKINKELFAKKWTTDLGLRYDNYFGVSVLSPRLNSRLQLNKNYNLRVGAGLFAKAPSLQALFPVDIYYDFLLANYRTADYAFALGHTFVRKYKNHGIKPSKTLKLETGIDANFKKWNFSLTGYYDRQYDGFTNEAQYELADLPTFDFTFNNNGVDYTQSGTRKVLLGYRLPTNGLETENYGVEVLANIKKIKSINTSFNISAAYRKTKTLSSLPIYKTSSDISTEAYIGLHNSIPTTYETLNSSITAIHHISDIGLVITLTAEQFILANSYRASRNIYPYAYYDRALNLHQIPLAEQQDVKYQTIRQTPNEASDSKIPFVYGNYHLRVAKEFENNLLFSFYAINFLNHQSSYEELGSDGQWKTRLTNRPISFGGTITYTF